MKNRKKINIGWIIAAIIFMVMGIGFFFIPVRSDISGIMFVKIVFPMCCLSAAYYAFYQSKHEGDSLYSPEKKPDTKMFRLIARAYENHRKENITENCSEAMSQCLI